MIKKVPKQGDIWWMNLSPTKGHEQQGKHPCYILSPEKYNRIGLCLICPITTQVKGYAGEVHLPQNLQVAGVILTDHIRNIDWEQRSLGFACNVSKDIKQAVYLRVNALVAVFGKES